MVLSVALLMVIRNYAKNLNNLIRNTSQNLVLNSSKRDCVLLVQDVYFTMKLELQKTSLLITITKSSSILTLLLIKFYSTSERLYDSNALQTLLKTIKMYNNKKIMMSKKQLIQFNNRNFSVLISYKLFQIFPNVLFFQSQKHKLILVLLLAL